MTTTEPPPAPAVLQIDLDRLTAILDAANETWRVLLTLQDGDERLVFLRIHVKQVAEYLQALAALTDPEKQ